MQRNAAVNVAIAARKRAHRNGAAAKQEAAIVDLQVARPDRAPIYQTDIAAFEHGVASIGIGTRQLKLAAVQFYQATGASDGFFHQRGDTGIDPDIRFGCRQADRSSAVGNDIAIGDELHAGKRDDIVDSDGTGCAAEHAKCARPCSVGRTAGIGPIRGSVVPASIAAIDRAISDEIGAVPEYDIADCGVRCGVDQVDLARHRGLDREIAGRGAIGQCAEVETVIGQQAGVIDQAVHAFAEAARVIGIEDTVERQVSGHVDQVGPVSGRLVGRTEIEFEHGRCGKREIAGSKRAHAVCPGRQHRAVREGDRAQCAPATTQQRTVRDVDSRDVVPIEQ